MARPKETHKRRLTKTDVETPAATRRTSKAQPEVDFLEIVWDIPSSALRRHVVELVQGDPTSPFALWLLEMHKKVLDERGSKVSKFEFYVNSIQELLAQKLPKGWDGMDVDIEDTATSDMASKVIARISNKATAAGGSIGTKRNAMNALIDIAGEISSAGEGSYGYALRDQTDVFDELVLSMEQVAAAMDKGEKTKLRSWKRGKLISRLKELKKSVQDVEGVLEVLGCGISDDEEEEDEEDEEDEENEENEENEEDGDSESDSA